MKNKETDKHRKPSQVTPIVDGDARPDQLDEKRIDKKLKNSDKDEESRFSSNRKADVNSLEDFKDEK